MTSKNLPEPINLRKIREYDGYFKIDRVNYDHQCLVTGDTKPVTRYVFERGDSAAILLHDPHQRTIVLVRQYRYPVSTRNMSGWILEIVAGSRMNSEDPLELIKREILEESGLIVTEPRSTGMFFLSPGGASERCFLFEATVDTRSVHGRIGGETGTTEETIVEVISVEEAREMIQNGKIIDAKTIIAIQQLLLGWIPGWHHQ